MSKFIKSLEEILAKLTDCIVEFLRKVLIRDPLKLVKFLVSIFLIYLVSILLKIPFSLLEALGSMVFGIFTSNVLFRLFQGIWMILLFLLYIMAVVYLVCLAIRRYFDKPKVKGLTDMMNRIYTSYPTFLKVSLSLLFVWLLLSMLFLFALLIFIGSFIIKGVCLYGIFLLLGGAFLLLLYIEDLLWQAMMKVGAKHEK